MKALTAEDCAKIPLVKRDVLAIANRVAGVTYPDENTMGYLVRGKCSSLLFYENVSLKQRLKEQGATTLIADVRNLHQLRSILLHPAYRDAPEIDPASLHVLVHVERLLKKILSSPIKDEQGRLVFTDDERKQLLLSPQQVADTLPSKAFAEADKLQEGILDKADRRASGEPPAPKPMTAEGEELKLVSNLAPPALASAAASEVSSAPADLKKKEKRDKTAERREKREKRRKQTPLAGDEVKPAANAAEAAPTPASPPAPTSAPLPGASGGLHAQSAALDPRGTSAPLPGSSSAAPAGAALTVSPKGNKAEGIIVGTYPGHTRDGKSCTVLIREKGQWYGKPVSMFKAQIIVGDMKPGSQVQDDEFAEVSFNQQSPGPAAPGASIKARTTVGELLALRRQNKLLPDPVIRRKTFDGENLSAVVENFAYKYERAGDRRVNENGELVRNIGARGEAAVRLVRQKTAIDAKTRDGMLTEMTLTTYSSAVGQDVSAGSYEAWRKSENAAERAEFDRPKSITCLIDKVQTPESVPENFEEH